MRFWESQSRADWPRGRHKRSRIVALPASVQGDWMPVTSMAVDDLIARQAVPEPGPVPGNRPGRHGSDRLTGPLALSRPIDGAAGPPLRRTSAHPHSKTWSASASKAGESVSPMAAAAFRLTTRRKRVGSSSGRSAGAAPLNIRSMTYAARSVISFGSGP